MMIDNRLINDIIILTVWGCLLISCYTDLRYRIISNYIVITIFLLTILNAVLGQGQLNYLASGIFLVLGLLLFYCRLIGAGDIKLITVLLISIPPNSVLFFLIMITLIGLPLAIIVLMYKLFSQSKATITLPYGIAISGSYIMTSITLLTTLMK